MKALRLWISLFAGIVLLLSAAQAETAWVEERITSGGTWFRGGTKIYEDKIYWNDRRSGNSDIYVWDRQGGERPLIATSVSEGVGAVYQDKVAITEYVNGQYDLYLYDPLNGKRTISTAPGDQKNVDMFGGLVVWEDRRGATPQVYIWDEVNGARPISPTNYSETNPRIWGDTVVFEDNRNGRWDVYMWNPREGERRLSTSYPMVSPAIYQNRVVMWAVDDPYYPVAQPGLWEWTPQGGLRLVAYRHMYDYTDVLFTDLWQDIVLWQGGVGPSNIGVYDPVHGFGILNESARGEALYPSIYGNTAAWTGDWDIYLSQLVPEPAGLLVLGLPAAGVLLHMAGRRRRSP